jgi:hypothetical protein
MDIGRSSREISANRVTCVITECNGGTDTGKCINPCGDDGDGRGVYNVKDKSNNRDVREVNDDNRSSGSDDSIFCGDSGISAE